MTQKIGFPARLRRLGLENLQLLHGTRDICLADQSGGCLNFIAYSNTFRALADAIEQSSAHQLPLLLLPDMHYTKPDLDITSKSAGANGPIFAKSPRVMTERLRRAYV
jgi:hypothetical protein